MATTKASPLPATSEPSRLLARITDLEQSVSLLLACPTSAREVARVRAELGQREAEAREERARLAERERRAPERLARFRDFAVARLAFFPELSAPARALESAYELWTIGEHVHGPLKMDEAELGAALEELAGVAAADVRPPGYMGVASYTEPGYTGVGITPEDKVPADVARAAATEAEQAEADRIERRAAREHAARIESEVLAAKVERDAGLRELGRAALKR
jgi:hypothetical protein